MNLQTRIRPFLFHAALISLLCVHVARAQSYQPPAGIPMPTFGVTETVRATYGSDTFFTYYVDNTHPAATDTRNPNGSPAKPRRSLPATLQAGDVVLIKAGTYSPPGDRFRIFAHGTEKRPVFIRGADPARKPVFVKPVHIQDAQWLIVENIRVQTAGGGLEIRPVLPQPANIHHVAVRHSEIIGNGRFKSGQSFALGSSVLLPAIHDVVFYQNRSQDAGQWDAEREDDTHSFVIGSNVQNAWILDNTAFRSGGDGVQVAHGALYSTHHVYIGRNTLYQHRENGVDLKQANDVIVSENTIYNHHVTSSSAGEGIVVHYDPQRIWILFNTVYDSNFGIVTTGSKDTYIIGNVISNTRMARDSHKPESPYVTGGAIHARNANQVYILNNTLYDYVAGIQVASGTSAVIQNNIFSGRSVETGYDINHEGDPKSSVMDYNLFDPGTGTERIRWGRDSNLSLEQFRRKVSGQGRNARRGAARFVNAAERDFRLAPGSNALKAGMAFPGAPYSDFASRYGTRILRDIAGKPRSPDQPWDMGAYQMSPGSP